MFRSVDWWTLFGRDKTGNKGTSRGEYRKQFSLSFAFDLCRRGLEVVGKQSLKLMQDSSIPIYSVTVGCTDGTTKYSNPSFEILPSRLLFLCTVIRVFVGGGLECQPYIHSGLRTRKQHLAVYRIYTGAQQLKKKRIHFSSIISYAFLGKTWTWSMHDHIQRNVLVKSSLFSL